MIAQTRLVNHRSVVRLWGIGASLLALACACQSGDKPAGDPAPRVEPAPAPSEQDLDGERRAQDAGSKLIGQPTPDLVLTTIDGATIDLARLRGKKPIYLKFWATWCVPCRAQMPGFAEIHADMHDKLEVVAVNTGFGDDEAAVRAFRDELHLAMPIVIDDGRLAGVFNLRVTPQHVVIGRDGRIVHVGHLEDARLEQALRTVVMEDGAAPPVAAAPRTDSRVFAVNDVVEGLSLTTMDGAQVVPGPSADGKPSALVFFATWCEPYLADSRPMVAKDCRRVREQVTALAAKPGVHWLGVVSGLWTKDSDLVDYVATNGATVPLALDDTGAVFRAFDVRTIPAVALLDGEGRLIELLGPEDSDIAGALAAIETKPAP